MVTVEVPMPANPRPPRCAALAAAALGLLAARPAAAAGIPAVYGVIQYSHTAEVPHGAAPALRVWVADRPAAWWGQCVAGAVTVDLLTGEVPAGAEQVLTFPRDEKVTGATCALVANFPNGLAERKQVTVSWVFLAPPKPAPAAAATPSPAPPRR
jgi:hypothetical protein